MGVFEFERTKSLIDLYLAKKPQNIIDVGGGTGKYSEWLSRKGHDVQMIEPVLKHVLIAQKRSKCLKNRFKITQGESQHLPYPDNFAELVILHGPLYHLQKKEDRIATILEAKRVVRKDGIILGFAINYTASTLAGLFNGLMHKKSFFEMCKEELTTGIHNPPNDFPWLLAKAYYHQPQQLKTEFLDQGLTFLNIYPVEGITWLDKHFFRSISKEKYKRNLLELLEVTENDQALLPFSPHIMVATKKTQQHGK